MQRGLIVHLSGIAPACETIASGPFDRAPMLPQLSGYSPRTAIGRTSLFVGHSDTRRTRACGSLPTPPILVSAKETQT